MGLIHTEIELGNAAKPELRPISAEALVDTGASEMCIPEHIAVQLALVQFDTREVIIANREIEARPYMGPLVVRFENRRFVTGAIMLGNIVLLGAIVMEALDLIVSPKAQAIVVNPEAPNMPRAFALTPRTKGAQ
jgi:clan AA aspartic protease